MRVLTTQDEVDTSETGNPAFAPVAASNFSAFHSNQSKDRAKKTQTDGCDHQSPACLDVACKHQESRQSTNGMVVAPPPPPHGQWSGDLLTDLHIKDPNAICPDWA